MIKSHIRHLFLSLLLMLSVVSSAQQYPVKLNAFLVPPYSMRLSDYAVTSETRIQLQLLMSDLMEPMHRVRLTFALESGMNHTLIASTLPIVANFKEITLLPGEPVMLTNVDIRPLFDLNNLTGISALNYSRPLPQGMYRFRFQAFDVVTNRVLSAPAYATVYLQTYDPPMLVLPQKGEKIVQQGAFQQILFQWQARQLAPNTRYQFTLKEIWDTGVPPETGFLTSRTLYEQTVYTNSLFYGADKTALIPGRRYAWQVKAISANPALPGMSNPKDDNGVYKNGGRSEIYYFDYVENCSMPLMLTAKNIGKGKVELRWIMPNGQSSKRYNVQYRIAGKGGHWKSRESYTESIKIRKLKDKTKYEYRIGAVCGTSPVYNSYDTPDNAFTYSSIQYFTTDAQEAKANPDYQCGTQPQIQITNRNPLQETLARNEMFMAGDFPVTVLSSEGGNGTYSGKGYIIVPYLGDTKLAVTFNNIQLNTERQLISGVVETTYDVNENNINSISRILNNLGKTIRNRYTKLVRGDYNDKSEKEKEKIIIRHKKVLSDLSKQIDYLVSKELFIGSNSDVKDIKEGIKQAKECFETSMYCSPIGYEEYTHEQKHGPSASLIHNIDNCEEQKKKCQENIEELFDKIDHKLKKEEFINYKYNNSSIIVKGQKYNYEIIAKRVEKLKKRVEPILNDLTSEEKLILDLPLIEWKLGFKTGAVFILYWLEGKGGVIKIPYNFIANNDNYRNIDITNIKKLFEQTKYASIESLGYSPSNPDGENLFLYNTSINSIKKAYKKLTNSLRLTEDNFSIGGFKVNKNGTLITDNNIVQSITLGDYYGEFSDLGTALGRFSQRIYIKGVAIKQNKHKSILIIEQIGTRYTDFFTFEDSGLIEDFVRSQDLGCWSKDINKPFVNRINISAATTCLQNNDFIKLKNKAKEKGILIGKDFFIYTKIKVIKNEKIIDEIPIRY